MKLEFYGSNSETRTYLKHLLPRKTGIHLNAN